MPAHLRHVQQLLPQRGHGFFPLPLRRFGTLRLDAPALFLQQPQQGRAIDLAVTAQGQLGQAQPGIREHVFGQPLPQPLAQGLGLGQRLPGQQHRRQLRFAAGQHQAQRAVDGGVALQGHVDFRQFDAKATDLDLMVQAPEKLQAAVGPVTALVASAVPAPAVMLDKALGAEGRQAAIAGGHPGAANPQLAGHPVRAVPALAVHHPEALVVQGPTVGDRAPVRGHRRHFLIVGPDRRLGGAAQGHELHVAARRLLQAPWQVEADPVAGHHGQAQCPEPGAVAHLQGQHVQQRRHRVPQAHPLLADQPQPFPGFLAQAVRGQYQGAADTQRAEEVVHRQVEIQG